MFNISHTCKKTRFIFIGEQKKCDIIQKHTRCTYIVPRANVQKNQTSTGYQAYNVKRGNIYTRVLTYICIENQTFMFHVCRKTTILQKNVPGLPGFMCTNTVKALQRTSLMSERRRKGGSLIRLANNRTSND